MSKVSAYLQGHISGEVSTRSEARDDAMHDQSVLEQKPEMVVYPRTTNDLRKLARFSWQLAEKGHILPLHIRGTGRGVTGAALGRGVVVDVSRHMNTIFECDSKQKLVRAQPGVSIKTLDTALGLQGMAVLPLLGADGTLGGAVAEDGGGIYAGSYGSVANTISQLEVVLDTGDLIQTGPLSKREVNHRKGLQGREGDIYRGIDAVLEDHADFFKNARATGVVDRSGYSGIFEVQAKGGQFDLTPLFVGSQGTLGLISEMIVKTDFVSANASWAVATLDNLEQLNETLKELRKQEPAVLEVFDGALVREAVRQGGNYDWLPSAIDQVGAVLLIGFDDLAEHARKRKVARFEKLAKKLPCYVFIPQSAADDEAIHSFQDIAQYSQAPFDGQESTAPVVIGGLYVPHERFSEFLDGVAEMAAGAQLQVMIQGSALSGMYSLRPNLSLHRVTDKQKLLKMLDQLNTLLDSVDGALIGTNAEGRTLAHFARTAWTEEYAQINQEIKQVFDPHGILNPDVKADVPLKDLIKLLRTDNGVGY